MYKNYIDAAQKVRQKLVSESKSLSTINSFDLSVKRYLEYLSYSNLECNITSILSWLSTLTSSTKKHIRYFQYLIAKEIDPTISKTLFYDSTSNAFKYKKLLPEWSYPILNEYKNSLHNPNGHMLSDAYKLIVFLKNKNCNSINEISCKLLLEYRRLYYFNHTKNFLEFLQQKGIINRYEKACCDLRFVNRLEDFASYIPLLPKSDITLDEYTKAFDNYLAYRKNKGYSKPCLDTDVENGIEFGLAMCMFNFNYSYEAADIFASYLQKKLNLSNQEYYGRRKTFIAIGYIYEGKEIPGLLNKTKTFYPSWFEKYASEYRDYRTRNHIGKTALSMDRSTLLRFSKYLDSIGIKKLEDIQMIDVKNFFNQDKHSSTEGKYAYVIKLKMFLEYIEDKKYVQLPLSKALPLINTAKVRPTTSIDDDLYDLIMQKCTEWENAGEYLKPLLIKIELFCGLRPIDIANLKIENVDWDNKEFSLCQQKTLRYIRIPFPTEIGNLLYLYLKNQRSKLTTENYLLVRNTAPYTKIGKGYSRRAILSATNGKISKTHLLRKTFATRLLKNNTSINEISNALGHSSNTEVDTYLDTNNEMMRECGLSLSTL